MADAVKPVKSRSMRSMMWDAWRTVALTWSVSRGLVVVKVFSALVTGLLPLLQAYLAGRLIDALVHVVQGGGDTRLVYLYILFGAASLLMERFIWSFGSYFSRLFDMTLEREFERRVFERVLLLDQSYYEDPEFTALFTKVRENLHALQSFVDRLTSLFSAGISAIGSTVILASFNPWLFLVTGAVVLPLSYVELKENLALSKYWDETADRWRFWGYFRWNIFGNLSTLKELKLYRAEDTFIRRFNKTAADLYEGRLNITRHAEIGRGIISALGTTVDAGIQIWLVGRVLATQGAFGVGDFQFYRGVIQNFATSLTSVAFNVQQLQDSFLYIDDYFRLMSFESRITVDGPGITLPPNRVPKIEFRNVSFKYPKSRKYVLKDVSFVVEPGERLAIVGENGAGKTTLLKLILRLYDPTDGEILIDDQPLRMLDLGSWYEHLGYLFQDFTVLKPFSVRENVALGCGTKTLDDARLERSLKQADAHSLVCGLPNGLEQILDASYKGGQDISGGQWQRLALARSFYREPSLLVLDEPTSAIDAEAEYKIFEELFRAHEGRSMLIVSHRFSTIRRATRILVLEAGKAIEAGTHHELMRLKGRYRELFELQAEGYRAEG